MGNYIIRTKQAGQEQDVAADLGGFAPVMLALERQKGWRRAKEVEKTILPRYVFASMEAEEYHRIKADRRVQGVQPITDASWRDVERFKALADRGDYNHSGPFGNLQPGQVMRALGGIFEHMLVTFTGLNEAKTRLIVEGDMMGQKVRLDMDPDQLEPAE